MQNETQSGSKDCCEMKPIAPSRNLTFSMALIYLKQGSKIRRAVWRGHWFLAEKVHAQCPTPGHEGYVRGFGFDKLIVAVLADGGGCAPATPYQADLLAEDWEIVS